MSKQAYEDRLRRVLQHIYDNPAGDLSLDALADVAAMSRFHWHRVFHGMTGETCAQAVRRMRAHRAAVQLVRSDVAVDKIAAQTGYDNVQSFNRTFRAIYGLTPAAYRKAGDPGRVALHLREKDPKMYDISVTDLPARRLAALSHTGPYSEVGRLFETLTAAFTARNLWPQATGMLGVYYDDPSAVPEAELRSHAGVAVRDGFDVPDDMVAVDLQPGRYAVLTYKGPYSEIKAAYDYLFGEWLPASGHEPADAPPFEDYINNPRDTAPADLITKICAPLKA